MLTAMVNAGAPGIAWVQYRSNLATAESAWWQNFAPTVMQNTYLANLSASIYQSQVDGAYILASTAGGQADAAFITSQAQAQDNLSAADAQANAAQAIAFANATGQSSIADDFAAEKCLVSQAQGDGLYTPADMDNDLGQAAAQYTLAVIVAQSTEGIASAQAQATETGSLAQSTASWTQAQDAAGLGVTVAESHAYSSEQMNLAALTAATYRQMGDGYSAAMATFAAAHSSLWATLTAANAAAAATFNDQSLVSWLAVQTTELAANSQAEITTAQAGAVFADQTAAAAMAASLSGAANQLAVVLVTQAGTIAQARAAFQNSSMTGGNGHAPSPPVIDPAYQITRAPVSDYNMSMTVTNAHADLVATACTNPWVNWLGIPHDTSDGFNGNNGSPNWSGSAGARGSLGLSVETAFFSTTTSSEKINAFQSMVAAHGLVATAPQAAPSVPLTPEGMVLAAIKEVAIQTVSIVVGIGVSLLTVEFGPVFSAGFGMAAMNATSALLHGALAGQSAGQIVYSTLTAGALGFVAGATGAAAAAVMAPIATGVAGALGLTCENGLGFVGAFLIGGTTGAVFGGVSSFMQTAITTLNSSQALDAAAQGAFMGGLIGGTLGVVTNVIDPFVCFTGRTLINKAEVSQTLETIHVGQRVLTEETKDTAHLPGDDPTEVDPAVWRLVRVQTAKPVGSDNIVIGEWLRSLAWIAENAVVEGRTIRLVLPELGIDVPADVLAIEPCPEIEPGRGRVVTGTFTRASCRVMELRFAGSQEVLEPTPSHRIFSEDRQDYVPAEDLTVGDRVRTRCRRALTISSTRLQSEPQKVYNCEVEHEHHFYVGQSGVLAHNACLPDADPASSVQGEEFRAAAEVWWDTLPTPSKFGATVAVSEFEGQQVVSLYANVGSGKYQFSQSQIDAFLESVENAGGMALHASGRVHAEELLHQMHAEAPAIGISNPYGPCDACNVYFQQQAYRNVYWPDE